MADTADILRRVGAGIGAGLNAALTPSGSAAGDEKPKQPASSGSGFGSLGPYLPWAIGGVALLLILRRR